MYVSLTDFKKILTGVDTPDDDDYKGTPAQLDDSVLETHLEDAQSQIDITLNGIYQVPFTDPPQLIQAIMRALAQYQADLTYRKTNGYQSNTNYAFIMRNNWAIQQLELLRIGRINLYPENADSSSLVVPHDDSPLFPAYKYLNPVRRPYFYGWELFDTY